MITHTHTHTHTQHIDTDTDTDTRIHTAEYLNSDWLNGIHTNKNQYQ